MVEIVPSILTNNPSELREMLHHAEGVVERVQIDIIDGQFAGNKTVDPLVLETIETSLKFDFHLMTKEPVDWVERVARAMADRIIGHIEMMESQVEFVGKVQEIGLAVGLAIDLDTPISELDATIINDLDAVLVMSVAAGFGGQEFDPSALLRVNELDKIRRRDDTPFKICIDGGVTIDNISNIRKAGADEVSIGKRIFQGDLRTNIDKFMKAAYK